MDKSALKTMLVERLVDERDKLAAAQRLSAQGVVHEDSRAEGHKDMRSTEASYIARGQAKRVEELEADLARLRAMAIRDFGDGDAIAVSALVTLESDAGEMVALLAPAGGGTKLRLGGEQIVVVTPASPLGRALIGARAGETAIVGRGERMVEYEVVRVR